MMLTLFIIVRKDFPTLFPTYTLVLHITPGKINSYLLPFNTLALYIFQSLNHYGHFWKVIIYLTIIFFQYFNKINSINLDFFRIGFTPCITSKSCFQSPKSLLKINIHPVHILCINISILLYIVY